MSANLVNIYAAIARKYGDNYTVTYATAPSYLCRIAGLECRSKIVLVYKEDRNRAPRSSDFISPSKLNIKKPCGPVDMNLTGSPLKDDCMVEAIADLSLDLRIVEENPWSPDEEYHKGIGVEKARSLVCSENFQVHTLRDIGEAQGSVWILCNGSDEDKTLLMQYEFAPAHNKRGIVTFMGVVPAKSVNCHSLLQRHYALMSSGSRVETYIENTYNIKPYISLRCAWSTTAQQPLLIDLSTCDVTLSQSFRISQSGPLTQDFINQISILKIIRDDILAHKEAAAADMSKELVYRCGRGIDMEELRESVNKVMTEISGFAEIDTGSGNEYDIETVLQRAQLRRLTDLTDKLWEILKRCSTYKDLKLAFNILFQCAARCNIVNTPTNKNRLAEIITEIANRRLAIPCLTGTEPLELLLEIGLEKLYKDYEYIFTESKICSANQLKCDSSLAEDTENNENALPNVRKSLRNAVRPEIASTRRTLLHNNIRSGNSKFKDDGVGFQNSYFDENETARRLAKLLQIHCTLEHLLMINIHLNLSNVNVYVCEQLLKKPPRYVDSIDDNLADEMKISLSALEVHEHLEGREPHSRSITMKSANKFRSVKSTFFYSMDNICPPAISQYFHTEDKEIAKDNTYFSWQYRKIETLK